MDFWAELLSESGNALDEQQDCIPQAVELLQLVDCLLHKHEGLSYIPSTQGKS